MLREARVKKASARASCEVGKTVRPVECRVKDLRTGAPEGLQLVLSLSTPEHLLSDAESFVHASLHELRAPGAGGREFFLCGDEEAFVSAVRDAFALFQKISERAEALGGLRLGGDKIKLEDLGDGREILSEAIARRRRLAAELRRLEIEAKLLDEQMKRVLRESSAVVGDGDALLVTHGETSRRCFDTTSFRRENPALADKYTVSRRARVLRYHG